LLLLIYSSDGDSPISRNWYEIPKNNWEERKSKQYLGNYMGLEIEIIFAEELNVNTPSAHYFFPSGDYKLHLPHTAHAAFSEKLPVWRVVVKGNEILIVAQNPYVKPGVKTTLTIKYEGWKKEIKLNDNEVYLDHFKL
jgi:hypothetical protein